MSKSRGIVGGLLAAVLVVALPAVSFADQENYKTRGETLVKLLRDSAAALQGSNPELAADLTKTADEKTKQLEAGDKEIERKKWSDGKTKKEMDAIREARIKLLRDSAAVLQAAHPELAAKLTTIADNIIKKMAEEKEGK